jgi:magnesium chelatase subunit D
VNAPGTPAREARALALDEAFEAGYALWNRAEAAASAFLVDPHGLGGIHVRSPAGPVRSALLREIRRLSPDLNMVEVPAATPEGKLIGGVSIEGSIRSGTLLAEAGLLSRADGGVLCLHMAERLEPANAGIIATALESGEIEVERSGASRRDPSRFGVLALDEGEGFDAPLPASLAGRLGLFLDLTLIPARLAEGEWEQEPADIAQARGRLHSVSVPDDLVEPIVATAAALAISSLRAPLFCLKLTRALAALAGRDVAGEPDVRTACDLAFAHLASPPPEQEEEAPPPPEDAPQDEPDQDETPEGLPEGKLEDQLIAAVQNAALLGALQDAARAQAQRRAHAEGRSGARSRGGAKGRPDRPRPASGQRQGRIDLLSTLRAAAPWQNIRDRGDGHLRLRPSDLHVKRHRHRAETSVVFVVDASGSAALNRLADVKGAIELLLSECYSRRDHVSLIAFRGEASEMLLAPTRSLTRVRRALAGLPAGGTTPLASALVQAEALTATEMARGRTPLVVILSDGRGNVALDPSNGREAADTDTETAAARLRALGASTLFFDTSRRPSPRARALSDRLGAAYKPLPAARASQTVAADVRDTIGRG